jgi:hypothetical protein
MASASNEMISIEGEVSIVNDDGDIKVVVLFKNNNFAVNLVKALETIGFNDVKIKAKYVEGIFKVFLDKKAYLSSITTFRDFFPSHDINDLVKQSINNDYSIESVCTLVCEGAVVDSTKAAANADSINKKSAVKRSYLKIFQKEQKSSVIEENIVTVDDDLNLIHLIDGGLFIIKKCPYDLDTMSYHEKYRVANSAPHLKKELVKFARLQNKVLRQFGYKGVSHQALRQKKRIIVSKAPIREEFKKISPYLDINELIKKNASEYFPISGTYGYLAMHDEQGCSIYITCTQDTVTRYIPPKDKKVIGSGFMVIDEGKLVEIDNWNEFYPVLPEVFLTFCQLLFDRIPYGDDVKVVDYINDEEIVDEVLADYIDELNEMSLFEKLGYVQSKRIIHKDYRSYAHKHATSLQRYNKKQMLSGFLCNLKQVE